MKEFKVLINNLYKKYIKRLIDIMISGIAIILLLPILFFTACIIRLDSKGSIIFKQLRIGLNGKAFYIYKFRTMVQNADKVGPKSTLSNDFRITPIGRKLRAFSIDELPQLVNVLKGDMSIVGFRPGVREDYDSEYLTSKVFTVKPGITGYAQVNGRSSLTVEEKKIWENKYVEDISFLTDFRILIKTITQVIMKKNTN